MEKQLKRNPLKAVDKNILWLFVLLVGLVVFASIAAPRKDFLTLANFQSIGVQFPELGIMSLGMMLCMIAGGIDLSIVGIANLSGIVAAAIMKTFGIDDNGVMVGAILLAVVVGIGCGALNGVLIGTLRIPAMLVTLCGQQIYMGLGLIITKGPAISGLSDSYKAIANGLAGGIIPNALIIFVIVAVVLYFIMRFTVYGQHLLLLGSNPTASRYSGINNLKVIMQTHIASGLLAAIAGVVVSSHLGSAKSDTGLGYTLQTLLICILGGVSPSGERENWPALCWRCWYCR
jgi:simple sugar transport system permease protein